MTFTTRTMLAAAALAVAGAVGGQSFPSRPVTLTVGFAPGGGTDTAARIIAQKLGENLGQSVVVDNKAGQAAMWPRSTSPWRRPTATRSTLPPSVR